MCVAPAAEVAAAKPGMRCDRSRFWQMLPTSGHACFRHCLAGPLVPNECFSPTAAVGLHLLCGAFPKQQQGGRCVGIGQQSMEYTAVG